MINLLACATLPATAARRLTIAQLEKIVAESAAKHRTDLDLVRMFADFELTERLTDAARDRIVAVDHLGTRGTLALQLLADQSATLDPPASEFLSNAPPESTENQRILNAARAYVGNTLQHLPDFLATRTTYMFDNTPQVLGQNQWPIPAGLHMIGKFSREVTVRDDRVTESPTPRTVSADAAHPTTPSDNMPAHGLQSSGEFGAILALIFVDTEKGTLAFHHWEQYPGGLVAVYRYRIPKSVSHYTVDYCCLSEGGQSGGRRGGRRGGSAPAPGAQADAVHFHKTPGYHGSLFIDPASGVILRIALEAEMGDVELTRVATVIQYTPVVIGDRRYVCPVRSMALTASPGEPNPLVRLAVTAPFVQVSETTFTNYHRLGSSSRILPGEEPVSPPQP